MFNCILCSKEFVYFYHLCDDCTKIKNIIKVYGKERIIKLMMSKLIIEETTNKINKTKLIKTKINNL